jgi:hypothetical protein
MEKLKPRWADSDADWTVSLDRLKQEMSELISLREKVAQAELAAHRYGAVPEGTDGEKSDQ